MSEKELMQSRPQTPSETMRDNTCNSEPMTIKASLPDKYREVWGMNPSDSKIGKRSTSI